MDSSRDRPEEESGVPQVEVTLDGLGPGKPFRDCTEAEQLKRIDDARKLLDKALAPWDERLRGEWDPLRKCDVETDR